MAQPFEDLDLTPKMADVIKVFLEDPAEPRYGFELMRIARQPSGTPYSILAKFEKHGWLTLGLEDIDPRIEGRLARRFCRVVAVSALVALNNLVIADRRVIKVRLRHIKPAPNSAAGFSIAADQSFHIFLLLVATMTDT